VSGRMLRALVTAVASVLVLAGPASAADPIAVDGADKGREFGGVGALSAGASSRLLFDYPEPERSQVLDYLFEPGYGASLQILKVEIGADVNSTSGSEAGHMRTPGEVNCNRGYEWWLMEEAKRRNPDIKLAALAWGAPGWAAAPDGTPDGGFYSPGTIDFYLTWLDCAERRGLEIDYLGGWNERGYDTGWYVDLDRQLEQRHPGVEIIAADDCCVADIWRVADSMATDPAFKEAVDIVGVHFACGHRTLYANCSSTATARSLGEPLWMSENSSLSHDAGGGPIARGLNRMYVDAQISGYISWSAISAWYANLPIADTGLMVAEWPWSGFYDVGKGIWANAHTTQFTRPGWHYLDTGSGRLDSGASYVTLASPSGGDYSTIVETLDAQAATTETFSLRNLPERELQVWASDLESDDEADHFRHAGTITPQDGTYEITLEPGHVYSISTRTDAGRGEAQPAATVHERQRIPFHESFERLAGGELARYFSDVNGAFEAAPCGAGRGGTCYRQVITEQPVVWNAAGFHPPTTVAGDPRWWGDYTLGSKVMLEQPGSVELIGRITGQVNVAADGVGGYHLRIGSDGWSMYSVDSATRARTVLASGDRSIEPGTWHDVELQMRGDRIDAVLDGALLARIEDTRQRAGNVALGAGTWVNAQFDDVRVTPTAPWPELASKARMSASASTAHGFYRGDTYDAEHAIDDRPETLWHSKFAPRVPPPHSLTLDLGRAQEVEALLVRPRFEEVSAMITDYRVEVSRDGASYDTVAEGSWALTAATKVVDWDPVQARYVRLVAEDGDKGLASVAELDVVTQWWGAGAPERLSPVPREQLSATATSWAAGFEPARAIDGRAGSFWHSRFQPREPLPQAITLDLGGAYRASELRYLPRQDGTANATVTGYAVEVSADGTSFTEVARGSWAPDRSAKVVSWHQGSPVRFVRLVATAGVADLASAAEIGVAYEGGAR
jgi:hypothetical protein